MRKTLLFVATSMTVASCGQNSSKGVSQSKAIVSRTQASEAFDIVAAIDYIPFNFIVDGCYARALYMSMELAAKRIPSSAHYIYGFLQPTSDISWSYHVAPLLKISNEEAWILDPSFEEEPLRLSAWIDKNNTQGRYTTEIKAGSAYFDEAGRTSEFDNNHMIQNFAEMPAFLTSDIASACTTNYNYISSQGQSAAENRRQRAKLITQTQVLVGALDRLGKLENNGQGWEANSACVSAVGL